MLQKVAAMVNKVAADLRFRACKVRWLLMKIFFAIAASSAAIFCVPLYNIVMPYLRHFSSFAPKIGDFGEYNGIYNTRKLLYYRGFRMGVFFWKKFSSREDCAEGYDNLYLLSFVLVFYTE